jgi:hypothetical protein
MKSLRWLPLFVVFLAGCEFTIDSPPAQEETCPDGKCPSNEPATERCPWRTVAPVDIPQSLRQPNYNGGSCMHASLITVLRSQHQNAIAEYWRRNFSGAAGVETCARIADDLALQFAYTVKGDEDFLEWCNRTRRAAAIYYGDNHAVTFCGYSLEGEAMLVDNNNPDRYRRIPKARFLADWHAAGGAAMTTVYASIPKHPWYVLN